MSRIELNNIVPFRAVHVGEVLADELNERSIKQSDLARLTGIAKPILNDIVKGRRCLTSEMALLIEAAIDIPSTTLMKIQMEYELDCAKISNRVQVQKKYLNIWSNLKNHVNMKLLKKNGVVKGNNIVDDIQKIFASAGVDNIEEFIAKEK